MSEKLDLDALEAVARAATPDGALGSYTFAGVGKLQQFQSKVSPNTVLALITRLREAEAVIEEVDDLVARHHLDTTAGQAVFKITGNYYKPTNHGGKA